MENQAVEARRRYMAEWRKSNKDKCRLYSKKWREANPEKWAEVQKNFYLRQAEKFENKESVKISNE